jgi:hypothetical protein
MKENEDVIHSYIIPFAKIKEMYLKEFAYASVVLIF